METVALHSSPTPTEMENWRVRSSCSRIVLRQALSKIILAPTMVKLMKSAVHHSCTQRTIYSVHCTYNIVPMCSGYMY